MSATRVQLQLDDGSSLTVDMPNEPQITDEVEVAGAGVFFVEGRRWVAVKVADRVYEHRLVLEVSKIGPWCER